MKRGPNPFAENSAKRQKTSDSEVFIDWLLDTRSIIDNNDATVSYDEVLNSIGKTIAQSPAQNAAPTHTIAQLIAAIRTKATHNVKYILQDLANYSLINMADQNGKTPLMVALQVNRDRGHHQILHLLLECGANPMLPSQVNKDNITVSMSPLDYVREILARPETLPIRLNAYIKQLALLKEKEATLGNEESQDGKENSLSLNVVPSDDNLLEFFIDAKANQPLINLEATDEMVAFNIDPITLPEQNAVPTHTLAHLIKAISARSKPQIESILRYPANRPLVNMTNQIGMTPLMIALEIAHGKGNHTILQSLLQYGANPMLLSKRKQSLKAPICPFDYVKEIIARPDTPPEQCIMYEKYLELFTTPLNKVTEADDKSLKEQHIYTANGFITAIICGMTINKLKQIFSEPANLPLVNVPNKHGITPLMAVLQVIGGRGPLTLSMLTLLLKHGANPNIQSTTNKGGITKSMSPIEYVQEILTRPEMTPAQHGIYTKYLKLMMVNPSTTETENNNLARNTHGNHSVSPLMALLLAPQSSETIAKLTQLLVQGENPTLPSKLNAFMTMSPLEYVEYILQRKDTTAERREQYNHYLALFKPYQNNSVNFESPLVDVNTDQLFPIFSFEEPAEEQSQHYINSQYNDGFSSPSILHLKNISGPNITQIQEDGEDENVFTSFFKY